MATNPTASAKADPTANSDSSGYLGDMEELKKVFNRFDVNGDGKISVSEMDNVLKTLGTNVPQAELKRVMEDLDIDQDGYINLMEFSEFIRNTGDMNSSELRDAFDLYDNDKNGLISAAELHMVLNRLGMNCSEDECRKMIKTVDADGDDNVNFEEFKKMMSSNQMSASANP